jgi:broad specificity phosphatase PhoE
MQTWPTVVLIRHVLTVDDRDDRYSDQESEISIVPVVPEIIDRLRAEVAGFISRHGVERIYCSDTRRGLVTAELVAGTHVATAQHSSLRNIHRPSWYGLREEELAQKYPTEYRRWYSDPLSVRFPGGETLSDVGSRIGSFLHSLDHTAIIITHTVPLQVIICRCLGLPLGLIWRFQPAHLKFSVLKRGRLLAFNTTSLDDLTLT